MIRGTRCVRVLKCRLACLVAQPSICRLQDSELTALLYAVDKGSEELTTALLEPVIVGGLTVKANVDLAVLVS